MHVFSQVPEPGGPGDGGGDGARGNGGGRAQVRQLEHLEISQVQRLHQDGHDDCDAASDGRRAKSSMAYLISAAVKPTVKSHF